VRLVYHPNYNISFFGIENLHLSIPRYTEPISMKRLLLLFLLCTLTAGLSHAQLNLSKDSTLAFATVEEGRQILTTRDDFVRAMSPFDRAARVKTAKEVTEADFLAYVGQHTLAWDEDEKQKLTAAYATIQEKIRSYDLPFPKTVLLLKTTGLEDSDACYTRSHAIILPKSTLKKSTDELTKVLGHELFHVLSRANPALKEKLYAAIGFLKCDEAVFPAELRARKITNPDAPLNDHCILLKLAEQEVWAVPILYSRTEKYAPDSGKGFFSYFEFRLLVAPRPDFPGSKPSVFGSTQLVPMEKTTGFFEQVGRNTKYIIHPEEILADNFEILISGRKATTPEVTEKIESILKR
jgi:hypothetical protein